MGWVNFQWEKWVNFKWESSLKVYQGQPHGFMIENGELSERFAAKNAYTEMVTFFDRTLRE